MGLGREVVASYGPQPSLESLRLATALERLAERVKGYSATCKAGEPEDRASGASLIGASGARPGRSSSESWSLALLRAELTSLPWPGGLQSDRQQLVPIEMQQPGFGACYLVGPRAAA